MVPECRIGDISVEQMGVFVSAEVELSKSGVKTEKNGAKQQRVCV